MALGRLLGAYKYIVRLREAQVHKTTTGQSTRSRPNITQSNMSLNLLSNQGGFVDDDNDAIVTENDEDLEENEDEASSRELVA